MCEELFSVSLMFQSSSRFVFLTLLARFFFQSEVHRRGGGGGGWRAGEWPAGGTRGKRWEERTGDQPVVQQSMSHGVSETDRLPQPSAIDLHLISKWPLTFAPVHLSFCRAFSLRSTWKEMLRVNSIRRSGFTTNKQVAVCSISSISVIDMC